MSSAVMSRSPPAACLAKHCQQHQYAATGTPTLIKQAIPQAIGMWLLIWLLISTLINLTLSPATCQAARSLCLAPASTCIVALTPWHPQLAPVAHPLFGHCRKCCLPCVHLIIYVSPCCICVTPEVFATARPARYSDSNRCFSFRLSAYTCNKGCCCVVKLYGD